MAEVRLVPLYICSFISDTSAPQRRSAEADPTDPLPVLVPAAASTPASGETAEDKKTRVAREVEEFLRRRERGADQGRRQGEGSLGLGK